MRMMTNRPSVGGRRVLVVEDEAVIGLALSELVEDEGCEVCGPFTRSDQAIAWLDGGGTPDVAIVDHILRDGPCIDLIRLLKARGIPFVIYSGNARRSGALDRGRRSSRRPQHASRHPPPRHDPRRMGDAPWALRPLGRVVLLHR